MEAHSNDSGSRRGDKRQGVSLCLSGGGYRAAIFHLGALRRLNELGLLGHIDRISSVSGGSIFAAHLASVLSDWPAPGERVTNWDQTVAGPFKQVVRRNVRTLPVLRRGLPWNWFRTSTQVEALAKNYQKYLTKLLLVDIPKTPEYIFSATDISYGVNWEFRRDLIGDYKFGHAPPSESFTLAAVVAASSCFPPIFSPMRIDARPGEYSGGRAVTDSNRLKIARRLGLSDGGLYDNLGLEPVWKTTETLLVSDGGSTFTSAADTGPAWRLSRYTAILGSQAGAIRRRWLADKLTSGDLKGAYWTIAPVVGDGRGGEAGYPRDIVEGYISRIRTDMDAFSEAEVAVLENHGYRKANLASRRYLSHLVDGSKIPAAVPNPDWMDVERVEQHLRRSHRRVLPLGRTQLQGWSRGRNR